MTPEEIARILDELGQRLGPAGQRVFELAVRQQLINGILTEIFGVVLLSVAVVILIIIRRLWDSIDSYDRDFVGVFGGLAIILLSLAGLLVLFMGASPLLNPEYAALHDLLYAIGRAR